MMYGLETFSKAASHARSFTSWGFCLRNSGVACYSSHTRNTAGTRANVSKQNSATVFSIYLALKTYLVELKMLLCIEDAVVHHLDLLNAIAPVSVVSSSDYRDHLKCLSPARTRSLPAPKVFIPSKKHVRR